jgi:hypothetical protein
MIYITGRNAQLYRQDANRTFPELVGQFESIDVKASPATYSYEGEQQYEIEWILSNGQLFEPEQATPDITVRDHCVFFNIYFAVSSIQYGDKIIFFPDKIQEAFYSLDYCLLSGDKKYSEARDSSIVNELRGTANGIDVDKMGDVNSYVFSLGY